MKKHKTISTLLGLAIVAVFGSCKNYYMVANTNYQDNAAEKLDSLSSQNRYFILRNGEASFHMNKLTVDHQQKVITYSLDSLPEWHQLHLTDGYGKMRYKKQVEIDLNVLNEVHLYVQPMNLTVGETYQLPLSSIQKIEVLVHDKKRSTRSHALGALAITGGIALGVLITAGIAMSNMTFDLWR